MKPDVENEIFYIHHSSQIKALKDFNTKKKHMVMIKHILEKMYPKHKQDQKEYLQKIEQFKQYDKVNSIIYDNVFKFIPSNEVLCMLVLKCAFENP